MVAILEAATSLPGAVHGGARETPNIFAMSVAAMPLSRSWRASAGGIGVGDLGASPEFGAVGTGDRPLQGGAFLDQFSFELGQ